MGTGWTPSASQRPTVSTTSESGKPFTEPLLATLTGIVWPESL